MGKRFRRYWKRLFGRRDNQKGVPRVSRSLFEKLRHDADVLRGTYRKAEQTKQVIVHQQKIDAILRPWHNLLAKLSRNRERKTWGSPVHDADNRYQHHVEEIKVLDAEINFLATQQAVFEESGDLATAQRCSQRIDHLLKTREQALEDLEITLKELKNLLP